MKNLAVAVLAGALFLGAAADASAQILSLTARGGLFAPIGDYDEAQGEADEILRDREGQFTFGGAINLNPPLSPFALRLNADYVTGSTLSREGVTGGAENEGDAETLYIAGDLILTPLPRIIVLQPFVAVGAGYRHTEFNVENIPSVTDGDLVGHLGLGFDARLGGFGLVAEVADYIARGGDAGPSIEHDLFLTAGVKIPIF